MNSQEFNGANLFSATEIGPRIGGKFVTSEGGPMTIFFVF